MDDLIKVNYENDRQTTSARSLWEFLGKPYTEFPKWFNQFKEFGFTENDDYRELRIKIRTSNGAEHDATDYEITIDMAKELAMLQKTEKGKQARQYFIELEKQWNSPGLVMARALKMADVKMLEYQNTVNFLETKVKELTPAAEFGNTVSNSAGGILIRDFSKVLENDGIKIGQDKLFSWLHANGYIYRTKERRPQWVPYKNFVEMGLFRLKETPISSPDHGDDIRYTIRVTGKGQKYFYEKLKVA